MFAALSIADAEARNDAVYAALNHVTCQQPLAMEVLHGVEEESAIWLPAGCEQGVREPFTDLALQEIARADRIAPLLGPADRATLLEAAIASFDRREANQGADAGRGWQRRLAESTRLALELAPNAAIGKSGLVRILAALAGQVRQRERLYLCGEAERLAGVVAAIAGRGVLTAEEWWESLDAVADPAPLPDWSEAYWTSEGQTLLHNVRAFLARIYIEANVGGTRGAQPLRPAIEAAVARLP